MAGLSQWLVRRSPAFSRLWAVGNKPHPTLEDRLRMRKLADGILCPFLGNRGPRVWRESPGRQLPYAHVKSGTENCAGGMPGTGRLGR